MAGGRMWLAQEAEGDARAVRMHLQGRGLPAEALLQRYLPPVRVLETLTKQLCLLADSTMQPCLCCCCRLLLVAQALADGRHPRFTNVLLTGRGAAASAGVGAGLVLGHHVGVSRI